MEYRLLRTPFFMMIFIRLSTFDIHFDIDIETALLSLQIFHRKQHGLLAYKVAERRIRDQK